MSAAMTQSRSFRIKRVYEPPTAADGSRVLIDRLWPRGVRKEDARIDLWLKELAPSAALRKWFGHDSRRWLEFKRRYYHELGGLADSVQRLQSLADSDTVTLVYAARDEQHNQARALADYLS